MHRTIHPAHCRLTRHGRRARRHHVVRSVGAILLATALVTSCSSSGAVETAVEAVQSVHSDNSATADAPPWCVPARTIDTLHTQFHAGGDVFPKEAEIQQLLDASEELESVAPSGDFATSAATFREGLVMSVETGSLEVFGEERYAAAGSAIFDRVAAEC